MKAACGGISLRADCREKIWPLRQLRLMMTWTDLGICWRMRLPSAPRTTMGFAINLQFAMAICRAVWRPKGARALGNGRLGEGPAARMIGMMSSGFGVGIGNEEDITRTTSDREVGIVARMSAPLQVPMRESRDWRVQVAEV